MSPHVSSVQKTDWAALGIAYLFFWYFSGIHHLLLQLTGQTIFFGFRQSIIVSTLWLVPLLLWPNQGKAIARLIGLILWLTSLASLGYFFIYWQEFSQSVIFIIFETNVAEAGEYVAQYFKWWMLPAFLAYTGGAYFLWRRVRKITMPRRNAWVLSTLILLTLFAYPNLKLIRNQSFNLPSFVESIEKRMEPATPWQLVFGYTQYRKQLSAVTDLLEKNQQLPPLTNLQNAYQDVPATLVLVIGESTNRQHMSLYGYPRKTSPGLDALRHELQVFEHVYAPRPYTIEVMQQVLSFADQQNPDLYLTRPSLINLMKQAGYKSFWITNQQTMTKRNTMLTSFSRQADEQVYLNNSRAQNSAEYDMDVVEPFKRALADPAKHKLIIVHLLGTHMKYEYRFPPEFAVFKDGSGLPDWVNKEQQGIINDYDNAVLYNDKVMTTLIESMRQAKTHGFMVYFSDHGEDVFDSGEHNVLGRNEGKPTIPMYAVPFFLWMTDSWRATEPRDFSTFLDRPYGNSHFIHTWSDLAGLSYDGFEPEKSLVSGKFKEMPVWIGDPGNPKGLIDLRKMLPGKP